MNYRTNKTDTEVQVNLLLYLYVYETQFNRIVEFIL